ncbi:MAG TPA: EpsI family protein, partial [Bryobacteraceae bacterium]|nr:EpsI family protein [Bryobacteraceae bacterium]
SVPGHGNIQINRYMVSRGEERSLVLYWYQSRGRTIANEYSAKFWLVADSIRYHRSDTALIRVVVPVGADVRTADDVGRRFIQAFYPRLLSSLAPVS